MTINEGLRFAAGFFTLLSLLLGYYVNEYWFLFTAFVGLNLLQSSFTKWCPMINILRALGFKDDTKVGG